jgi:S-adenosylmethionine/arginine decarboxylase-like enzyme/uncharacterized protein with PQ loop repeat
MAIAGGRMLLSHSYEVDTAEIIGYVGGGVLAVALAPQLIKSCMTRSTEDISYMWQAIYIVGLWLNFVYFVMVDAVAAWATLLIEIAVAHALLILKLRLDGCSRRALQLVADPTDKSPELPDGIKRIERSVSGMSAVASGRTPRSLLRSAPKCMGDAARRTRPVEPVGKGDLLTDHYRGFHYTIDAVFSLTLPAEFGHTMMTAMLAAAEKHGVRVVSNQIEIFDGTDSPPGFASACLIDESHMSAHCYTDQGMIAFDCFTCGANPEGTRRVTNEIYNFLGEHLGPDAIFEVSHMPRFPRSAICEAGTENELVTEV